MLDFDVFKKESFKNDFTELLISCMLQSVPDYCFCTGWQNVIFNNENFTKYMGESRPISLTKHQKYWQKSTLVGVALMLYLLHRIWLSKWLRRSLGRMWIGKTSNTSGVELFVDNIANQATMLSSINKLCIGLLVHLFLVHRKPVKNSQTKNSSNFLKIFKWIRCVTFEWFR